MNFYGRDLYASEEVRTIPCPSCNAPAGQLCVGAREKPRVSNHMERVNAYKTLKVGDRA